MADITQVFKSMTVTELQAELSRRGLKKSGKKAILIERLTEVFFILWNQIISVSLLQNALFFLICEILFCVWMTMVLTL